MSGGVVSRDVARDDSADGETVSKPVGPFDDIEECVGHFEDDPDVEDPGALCRWMEQRDKSIDFDPETDDIEEFVQSLDDDEADKVLSSLTTEFVSAVETPAQDSMWVAMKDADGRPDWSASVPLVVSKDFAWPSATDEEKDEDGGPEQKALAPVLVPNETDKQGDVVPKGEIENAAHEFLKNYRQIDTDHDLVDGKGEVVESYTLDEPTTFERVDGEDAREYPEGTWMMMVEFSDEAWERVEAGELTGFSIYGEAEQTPVADILGESAKSDEGEGETPERRAVAMSNDSGPEALMTDHDFAEFVDLPDGVSKADLDPDRVVDVFAQHFEAAADEVMEMVESESDEEEDEADEDDDDEDEDEEGDDTMMSEGDDSPDNDMTNKNDDPSEGTDGEQTDDGVEDTLASIKSTVENTSETVESVKSTQDDLQERVDALESAVDLDKSDDPADDSDAESGDAGGADDAQKEAVTVKDLGLDPDDLPDDEEERREAIRKAAFEPTDDVGDDEETIDLDFSPDELEV